MARPRKSNKRVRQLNLKLTEREFTWVAQQAVGARMTPVDFGRAQLFATRKVRKFPDARPHLDPLFMAQVARMGNNLNQIARRFHQFHLPAPAELDEVLAGVREIIRKGGADGS
jgi:hypothetical protein